MVQMHMTCGVLTHSIYSQVVEYLVYGSNREDATVMVQMHGATSTGGLMCTWNAEMFKQLNIRGIAPTMPNSGYSDIQAG